MPAIFIYIYLKYHCVLHVLWQGYHVVLGTCQGVMHANILLIHLFEILLCFTCIGEAICYDSFSGSGDNIFVENLM